MEDIIISIVFYLVIYFCLVFFAKKVDTNKNVKFSIFMLVFILTLVAGLRHQCVGIDTEGYVSLISQLRGGYLATLNNISEQGFIFLSYLLVCLSKGYTLALIVYAAITNALIILRLYDYKDKISFIWSISIYYMIFYFSTFNTIRQWIAIALVFWGTRYIGQSIIKYLLIIALAVSMHTTAIFAFFFAPIYHFSLPSKTFMEQIKKLSMFLLAIVAGAFVYLTIVNKYSGYIASSTLFGDASWVNIISLLFMIFIVLYDNNGKIVIRIANNAIQSNRVEDIKFETLLFLVGILLTLAVFFTRYADRIGQYFLLFETVFLSYYIRKERTRNITRIFVVLLCVYLRLLSFLSSGYGEVPYVAFWM